MTKAALTKLLILVILTFIICLPEFFTSYRVLRVNFLCTPHQPSEEMKKMVEGEVKRRKGMCDRCLTSGEEKQELVCPQGINVTGPGSDLRDGGADPSEEGWFMCETDMDVADLQDEGSLLSPETSLEVSVEVQLGGAGSLNLTLYGHRNHSSLYLHPPEAEEEEEKEEEDEGRREAFYCCLPVPPSSEPTNQSHCLLQLTNQTALTARVKEKLPWKRTQRDEWFCVFRVLWLVLLCVVLLTVATTVLEQICHGRRCTKKLKLSQLCRCYTRQHLNESAPSSGNHSAGEQYTEMTALKGTTPRSFEYCYSSPELSPIEEVETSDTLLDGDVDHQYDSTGAHLHHRSHPPVSSLAVEQA
ncbi:uncharacterized protein LOC115363514 isoform X2 [Myripristis murdjan]|uniref:uncharacterized protein LOC115363514 isoform X2 n=1 Tax=Myripristis murdjan TaxID=586833 RepID=UPI001176368C|nr:uncharacterized protein LOC115363514 isoform X2 [Myripristis murdjan]